MLLYKDAVWQLCWGTAFVLFAVMSLGAGICSDVETGTCSREGFCPICSVCFPFQS
jgi:hypothetical protein